MGHQLAHNDLTGFEVQPSARLQWTPTKQQTVWGAVSRAVRTPSIAERDIRVNAATFPSFPTPGVVSIFGNPNARAEALVAYELGYRVQPVKPLAGLGAALVAGGVLGVGETESFLQQGGTILLALEGDKLRFEIDMSSADAAKLKVSAHLQKLARKVRRTP